MELRNIPAVTLSRLLAAAERADPRGADAEAYRRELIRRDMAAARDRARQRKEADRAR